MLKRPRLEQARETTVAESAQYLKRHRKKLKVHVHEGPIKSVRTEKHRGHAIKITATYDIRIDGRNLGGHLEVGNDGHVHYHGLPNYTWGSMVDMCRQLIDSFPAEFPSGGRTPPPAAPVRAGKTKKAASPKTKRKTTTKRASPRRYRRAREG